MRIASCMLVAVLGLLGCDKPTSKDPAPTKAAPAAPSTPAAPTPAPAAPAPGAPAAGGLLGSCAIAEIACSDYYGAGDVAPLKNACAGAGTWSDAACRAGAVGTCTTTEAGGITNKAHTYPPGTPASAKQACANTPGGVYSDG